MRILRGCGLKGIRGILPKKNIRNFQFIRPLLEIKKKEVEFYLKKNKIRFRIDPTNKQTKFFRNKIRHKLLPLLEAEYSGNLKQLLANLSQNVIADFDYLESQAQKIFKKLTKVSTNKKNIKFDIDSFKKQHKAIQRMLVRIAIKNLKGNTNRLTFEHNNDVQNLIQSGSDKTVVSLPDNIRIQKNQKFLSIYLQ